MKWRRHANDAELLEFLLPHEDAPSHASPTAHHVDTCEPCQTRSNEWRQTLDGLSGLGRSSFDDLIAPHHLDAQRRRVMTRIERLHKPHEPAQVLRFPARTRPRLSTVRFASRWMSVAAAAGLLVGVTIGQFLHLHPQWPSLTATDATAATGSESDGEGPAPVTVVVDQSSTASLLDEIDLVLTRPQIAELTSLDEFTPRIREIAINPW